VIAEITGPMSIAGLPADEAQYTADWKLLQASLRGRPRAPQRLSLAADKPTIQRAGAPLARAEHLELHVRRRESSEPGKPLFDLGARVTAGTIEGAAPWLSAPLDMEAAAILHGLDDFSAKPLAQRLREWQAADGRLEIAGVRLQQGEALAVAKGSLSLDAEGRPSGSLNVTMAGFDRIVKAALGGEGGGRVQGLWAGLAMLSRAELEGRRAVALPLTIRDGRVLLGPIPIAQLHPLF
jgi:hypothetical protein